jgi:hypothetical protein
MLKAVKRSVHRMTSHLQLISSYLEMTDYTKALGEDEGNDKGNARAGIESNGAGEPGDGRAGRWGRRGSARFHSGELRRRECGR